MGYRDEYLLAFAATGSREIWPVWVLISSEGRCVTRMSRADTANDDPFGPGAASREQRPGRCRDRRGGLLAPCIGEQSAPVLPRPVVEL